MTRTDLHRCYSPISFTVIRTICSSLHTGPPPY
ncbi:TPA: phage tail protein, partial [Escherichia coli]|nr:phage tail protein [Escherichia coli]